MASTVAASEVPTSMFYCHQCTTNFRKSQNSDFSCPVCREGFIEEVNDASNAQSERESASDPIFSIIHRLISEVSPRRARGQGSSTSSRRRVRSRSPRMSFYIGSSDREPDSGSSSRRLASSAFHFDLDDLMSSFLQTPRPPPVSQRKLAEIPKIAITAEHTTTQCSICFDEFKLAEIDVRKLPCSHLFHEKCIFPWLRTSGTCPVCRASLNQPGDEPEPDASPNASNFDNILRFMRQRRNARREANEPTTSSSSAQTEQQAPALPIRRRNLSSRVAADRVASRLSPSTPGVSEAINNSTESRLEALYNRTRAERRLAISRHRRRLHGGPDNDIHRVARSQTYSDLLDNPLGPTTRAARRSNQPRMMELVDLTASDTESSILSRLTRIPSSSSSSSGSSLSIPSPLSMDTSDSDSSDSDGIIRLPSQLLPINDPSSSSSSSSSSDHEE